MPIQPSDTKQPGDEGMMTLGVFALGCWGGFALGLIFAGMSRVLRGPAATTAGARVSEALEAYTDLTTERARSVL